MAKQITETIVGRTVTEVFAPTYLHKFTFFNGDSSAYRAQIIGRKVVGAVGRGIFLNIEFEGRMFLALSDGVNIRYGDSAAPIPKKYQLLITDNQTFLVFTTAMYGGIYLFHERMDNFYYNRSADAPSPLSREFDRKYFDNIVKSQTRDCSVKALLQPNNTSLA